VTPDHRLMSVACGPEGPAGLPRLLPYLDLPRQWAGYEFGGDGESIVALREIRDPRDEPIHLILDWQGLLKK
jgi:hypothetical protein